MDFFWIDLIRILHNALRTMYYIQTIGTQYIMYMYILCIYIFQIYNTQGLMACLTFKELLESSSMSFLQLGKLLANISIGSISSSVTPIICMYFISPLCSFMYCLPFIIFMFDLDICFLLYLSFLNVSTAIDIQC